MKKKLSIIIPVYNGEKYIKECLDSILNYVDEGNVDVLIINDGSTDMTKEILTKYNRSNIKVYNNENHGVSFSRNFGICKADSEYIMFVDADDILNKEWYEMLRKEINSDYDFLVYSKKISNSNKSNLLKYITGLNHEEICIAGPFSKIYRLDFLNSENIRFKEDLINGEDMIFNAEVLIKAKKFNIINKTFYLYRSNVGSATKRFDRKIIESDKKFHKYLNVILHSSEIEERLKEKIKEFSKINGIITILYRIAYNKNYKDAKHYYNFIEETPYCNVINEESEYVNKYNKLIMNLAKKKRYYFVYILTKFKNMIVNMIRKKYEFIEI